MSRLLPHPLLSLILTLVWLLLVNSMAPGHILLGLVLGLVIPLATGPFWPGHTGVHRPLTLLRFFGILGYDILTANIVVARLILTSGRPLRPAFVVMPLTLRSDLAISLLLEGKTVKIKDEQDNEYEPRYAVSFKKSGAWAGGEEKAGAQAPFEIPEKW